MTQPQPFPQEGRESVVDGQDGLENDNIDINYLISLILSKENIYVK